VVDLYFITDTHDVKILGKIYNYKNRYIALSDMVNIRNQLYINQVQEIISNELGGGVDYITMDRIKIILGLPLYGKIVTTTDYIYCDTKYIINNYNEIKLQLNAIFKYLYPGAKIIEIFMDNQ
jgi:hypothetical protein